MPTLTTLRIGLPVWPRPLAGADPLGEGAHAVERLVHLLDDVDAVDDSERSRGIRSATCRTARSSETLMCSPANIASRRSSTPRSAGQLAEQQQRLVGDPVLGEVEVEAGALGDQPLAALGVGGEELAQMGAADLLVVACSCAQAGGSRRRRRLAHPAVTPRWEEIEFSSSSQDLLKLSLPSSWSRAARAATSIPASLELGQDLLGVAAVGGKQVADLAVVGEGEQGRLGHRVDREGRGEGLDVERVGGVGVLGPGAGPEQALGARALVQQPLPAVESSSSW